MQISELAIHPLKSARRVVLPELALGPLGPEWDRRWMLVDAQGDFVTQRSHPRLCLLSATVEAEGLRLAAPGMPPLLQPFSAAAGMLTARVWNHSGEVLAAGADADAWCSAFLGQPVRLAFWPETALRPVDPERAGPGHRTTFSDGFPILLVTQSSLDHLNGLLREEGLPAVDWSRFRPNVVVAGDVAPHAEDGWRRLRLGEVELALVKPCSRCVIPSIDPGTGVADSRLLAVLRRYRAWPDGKIYVGQNAVVARAPAAARLRRGDMVEVLE